MHCPAAMGFGGRAFRRWLCRAGRRASGCTRQSLYWFLEREERSSYEVDIRRSNRGSVMPLCCTQYSPTHASRRLCILCLFLATAIEACTVDEPARLHEPDTSRRHSLSLDESDTLNWFTMDEAVADTSRWYGVVMSAIPSFRVAGKGYQGIVCTDFQGCMESGMLYRFWIPSASDISAMEESVARCFANTNCLKEGLLLRYNHRGVFDGGELFRAEWSDTSVSRMIEYCGHPVKDLDSMIRTYVGIFHGNNRQIDVRMEPFGPANCPLRTSYGSRGIRFRYDVETRRLRHLSPDMGDG